MLKFCDRALLKAPLVFVCVLAASFSVAQDHRLVASIASPGSTISDGGTSNDSSSRLPDDAIVAVPIEAASPSPVITMQPSITLPGEMQHRFWDRENAILFTAVGAAATADFFTTHANLASGGRELNPVTRIFAGSTPTLAANFALEAASVIGISYVWHKTGHHKLERLTSFLDIGGSAGAVTYDLTHR